MKPMSLADFRKRFEVVPTDDLSARDLSDLTAREPTKYYDPFAEREDY